jgi:condensin complex subunit 1
MLHLIWSKDSNATSEDGKELKGVRAKLLECYCSLYFDASPDLDAKQQVIRIAKNMIEFVVPCQRSLCHLLTRAG